MPRLVTFGCSFVYGHGLPDCHIEPDRYGPKPSKFAWPQLLANKLKYECVNLARCGSGNFQILMQLLSSDLKKNDLVIIGWSFFNRFDCYQMTDLEGNTETIGFWSKGFESLIMQQAENDNFYAMNAYDNWLAMQHAELFLKNKKIKNFSFLNLHQDDSLRVLPKYVNVDNFWFDQNLVSIDRALDKNHPGLESHKLQAMQIYDRIQKIKK